MLPLIDLHTVGSQYYQAVGKAKRSSMLSFLRYGVIIIPTIFILTPRIGVNGIYISNALSDGLASVIAIIYIIIDLRKLKQLEQ